MRLLGKFGMTACAAVVIGLAATTSASAATILIADFCPDNASCPTGLTQARLTIDDNQTPAVNDYLITATFTGTAAAPSLLDMFSFTLGGVATPAGYQTPVTLTSATSNGAALNLAGFQTVYDNVSNTATACTTNTNSSNEVCTNTLNSLGIPLPGNTLVFTFLVDLAGNLTIGTDLNLRANFNGPNGILSPNGRYTNGEGVVINPTGVPEPASMVLFGLAALAGARRVRRR